jgi:hypothetical protein
LSGLKGPWANDANKSRDSKEEKRKTFFIDNNTLE